MRTPVRYPIIVRCRPEAVKRKAAGISRQSGLERRGRACGNPPHARHGARTSGTEADTGGPATAAARSRPGPGRGGGLRRLPHRPPRGRRRIAAGALPDRARPRDRRPRSSALGDGRRPALPSASGSACPGSAGPAAIAASASSDMENLCDTPHFTGCDIDGGYAEYVVADARYCFRLPDEYGDAEAAPLLCAGLIGHRAHRMAGDGEAARPLRLRRRRPHRRAGRPPSGPARLRLHAARRHARRRISPAASARNGPAVPTRRRPSRSTPRSSSRRSGRSCRRR